MNYETFSIGVMHALTERKFNDQEKLDCIRVLYHLQIYPAARIGAYGLSLIAKLYPDGVVTDE